MRFLCFLFLLAFVGVIVAFGYYNQEDVTLRFYQWTMTASMALVVGAVYVLGMLSGWTVVGTLRRTLQRVTERPQS
jgi:uncharacterized membrane protein YciS (DUF1049 family)